jgi:hypothetical protein
MARNESATTTPYQLRKLAMAGLSVIALSAASAPSVSAKPHGLKARSAEASKPVIVDNTSLCESGTHGANVSIRSASHNMDTLRVRVESQPLPEICKEIGNKTITATLSEVSGKTLRPVLRAVTTVESGTADKSVVVKRLRTNPGVEICSDTKTKQFVLDVRSTFEADSTEQNPDTIVATRYAAAKTTPQSVEARDSIDLALVGPVLPVRQAELSQAEVFTPSC